MEERKEIFCRLCLQTVNDNNFREIEELREALNVLLIYPNLDENEQCVMCSACSLKVKAAFKFKTTCMDNEKHIFPYIKPEDETVVELRDVYAYRQRYVLLPDISEGQQICRLCLKGIENDRFLSMEEVNLDMIPKYIPEVNWYMTKDPVICIQCCRSLETHCGFIRNCLYLVEKPSKHDDKFAGILPFIKTEEVEIKTEADDDQNETPIDCSEEDSLQNDKRLSLSKITGKIIMQNEQKVEQRYNCTMCNFQANNKEEFLTHISTYRTVVYTCDGCDFQSPTKSSLTKHRLKNQNHCKQQRLKCNLCSFRTMSPNSFQTHLLLHKDVSRPRKFKCNACNYVTGHKGSLASHQLIHKNRVDVKLYECHKCDYKAIRKSNLKSHQAKHGLFQEVMRKCTICNYQTNYRHVLKIHMASHEKIAKEQKYKCDKCDFECKSKLQLISHRVTHLQVFKCEWCDYQTVRVDDLPKHRLKHLSDADEIV